MNLNDIVKSLKKAEWDHYYKTTSSDNIIWDIVCMTKNLNNHIELLETQLKNLEAENKHLRAMQSP